MGHPKLSTIDSIFVHQPKITRTLDEVAIARDRKAHVVLGREPEKFSDDKVSVFFFMVRKL